MSRRSVILDACVRAEFHTLLLVSLYFLFAGHNQPGGGFAGGLVASCAFALRFVAGGDRRGAAGHRRRPPIVHGRRAAAGHDHRDWSRSRSGTTSSRAPSSSSRPPLIGEGQADLGALLRHRRLPGRRRHGADAAGAVRPADGSDPDSEHDDASPDAGPIGGGPVIVLPALVAAVLVGVGVYLLLQRTPHPDHPRPGPGRTRREPAADRRRRRAGHRLRSSGASPRATRSPTRCPQALALTAIVIAFGISAFLLALAYRSLVLTRDDEVEDDIEDRRIAEAGRGRVQSLVEAQSK